MKTVTFDNAKAIVVKEWNPATLRSDYADPRGFGTDKDLAAELSNGTIILYNYWSGPYDTDGSSRTLLFRGTQAGAIAFARESKPELLQPLCEFLGCECPEVL